MLIEGISGNTKQASTAQIKILNYNAQPIAVQVLIADVPYGMY